jgi:hypothetical protein
MNWIEVINLQTANTDYQVLKEQISGLVSNIYSYGGLKQIKLFHNAVVNNNTCIHLYWTSEKPELQGSAAGQCLVHVLKEYGLAAHSVWIEEEVK